MTLMGRYIILFMLMLTSCAEMLAGMESLRIMTYNVPRKQCPPGCPRYAGANKL